MKMWIGLVGELGCAPTVPCPAVTATAVKERARAAQRACARMANSERFLPPHVMRSDLPAQAQGWRAVPPATAPAEPRWDRIVPPALGAHRTSRQNRAR